MSSFLSSVYNEYRALMGYIKIFNIGDTVELNGATLKWENYHNPKYGPDEYRNTYITLNITKPIKCNPGQDPIETCLANFATQYFTNLQLVDNGDYTFSYTRTYTQNRCFYYFDCKRAYYQNNNFSLKEYQMGRIDHTTSQIFLHISSCSKPKFDQDLDIVDYRQDRMLHYIHEIQIEQKTEIENISVIYNRTTSDSNSYLKIKNFQAFGQEQRIERVISLIKQCVENGIAIPSKQPCILNLDGQKHYFNLKTNEFIQHCSEAQINRTDYSLDVIEMPE